MDIIETMLWQLICCSRRLHTGLVRHEYKNGVRNVLEFAPNPINLRNFIVPDPLDTASLLMIHITSRDDTFLLL